MMMVTSLDGDDDDENYYDSESSEWERLSDFNSSESDDNDSDW